MCLAAGATDQAQPRTEDVRRAIQAATTIDIHSHAGGIASVARMRSGPGFEAVAAPMRQGGMAVICWAVVSDGPTHHVASDGRIHPYRDPAPGELYEYAELAFDRVLDGARAEPWHRHQCGRIARRKARHTVGHPRGGGGGFPGRPP
jgi:hypothetical protein